IGGTLVGINRGVYEPVNANGPGTVSGGFEERKQ
ncbi:MAG: hypothetical protein RLZ78_256, partial [Actinomycetota bacterium]